MVVPLRYIEGKGVWSAFPILLRDIHVLGEA